MRWRILIAYLLIIVTAFLVIGFSLLQLVGEYMFNASIKEDSKVAETLAEQMVSPFADLDADRLFSVAMETVGDADARVLVIDTNAVIQLDTQSELNGTRFNNAQAVDCLLSGNAGYGFYDVTESGFRQTAMNAFTHVQSMNGLYAAPIKTGMVTYGVVIYIASVQEIYESLQNMQLRILLWLVVVAAAVITLSTFVFRSITRPVGELREGISKMSAGDLSSRVKVRGHNEFSELAQAFNSMSERIELLDKSRSQFVSSASHELKTPLSTMKILIETLMYQEPLDPVMTKDFLNDVNKEIDRLNRIVSDLLTLVNIDSGGIVLHTAEVDLLQLVQEQIRRLSPLARENGIELDCVAKDALKVNGDAVKLQQVIYNIIDNAIKYTSRGGEVICTLTKSGKKAVMRIADTGIGIPANDLPHIFDRFYRVDKARSRATGGTGLGLSIVKQIVQLHGGTITAVSEEGKGTTFTVELPLLGKGA